MTLQRFAIMPPSRFSAVSYAHDHHARSAQPTALPAGGNHGQIHREDDPDVIR